VCTVHLQTHTSPLPSASNYASFTTEIRSFYITKTNMSGRVSPQNNHAAAATPESLALSRLRVKSISHPLQQCQITVFVPPNTVGAIIGRGGGKILSVQKEAMRKSLGHTGTVKISVLGGNNSPSHTSEEEGEFFPSASNTQGTTGATWNYHEFHSMQKENEENFQTDNEEDDEVPVIIRGDPIGCFAAVRQILPLVYYRHDPDVVFEVPIHRLKHNLLVGKGGLILAALSAEYEVRIMIPPNDLMENVGGTVNWHQNQYTNDTGSTMLFSQTATSPMNGNDSPLAINSHSTLPPNVIQLEGHIDKCEKCLVKMLSIVAGEKWIPPGVIVHPNEENEHENEQKDAGEEADFKAENVKAFAIVTANSDSPNVGQNKLRTIQRKTSTLIRRKKGRFMLKGVEYGATNNDDDMVVAEEPSVENDEDEEKDDAEEEEDDDQVTSGPKVSISFLISGKIENVKLAASQFEKILGLEPNSAVITLKDSSKSSSSPTSKGDTGDSDAFEKKRQKHRNFNRREKKRVGKNNTDKAGE
jgi:hypothetical protein